MTKAMALRPSRLLPDRLRLPALLVAGVMMIAAGVWIASHAQREAASRVALQARDAQAMMVGMLDQETGLRGYLLTGRDDFLEPYTRGREEFDSALDRAREAVDGDPAMRRAIDAQEAVGRAWQSLAEAEPEKARERKGPLLSTALVLERRTRMDRFRALNADFDHMVEMRRSEQMHSAGRVAVGVILALGLVFGVLGTLLIRRGRIARERDQEFAEDLQVMRTEAEAHKLLRDHVERSVGGRVTVLTRNNSADRLEASTCMGGDDELLDSLEGASPDSCLAVRLARPHSRCDGDGKLLQCDLCGKTAGGSLCQPLLVGGEVLGSVLLRKDSAPGPPEAERLAHAVSRAAPALANMRNLAIAEARAHTDPLTGLANKRSIQDNLRRLHAHAARTASPLSAVVVDLDHFKSINDTFGHERGDQALVAATEALAGGVRRSDFVGRLGGEEFIVLLPDSDAAAADGVAEKLRQAIRALRLPGMHDGISASFGVATFPDDATDPDELLRLADRALYLAKKLGRDRVERASSAISGAGVTTSGA
jgi:diguanylate cyclase (GGDEF)-like protein